MSYGNKSTAEVQVGNRRAWEDRRGICETVEEILTKRITKKCVGERI